MSKTMEILIIGAGPVGLTTACELWQRNIPCRIIEKRKEPHVLSKAFAVHSRTIEVLQQLGVSEAIVNAGRKIRTANFFTKQKKFLTTPFAAMETRYPFLLALPQCRVERILEMRLESLGGVVERGVEVVSVSEENDCVSVEVADASGMRTLTAAYIVAADGPKSRMRKLLRIPFQGKSYANAFIVVDAKVTWDQLSEGANTYLTPKGYLMVNPFPEAGMYRIVLGVAATKTNTTPTLDEVNAIKDTYGFSDLQISDPLWISQTNVQRRLIANYRYNNVFFAGDAAHVNSPVGGQGMNMGIQDAHNLAWKLAYVYHGYANENILESYHTERYPIATQVLKFTEVMNTVLTTKNRVLQTLRNVIYGTINTKKRVAVKLALKASGLAYQYKNSRCVDSSVSKKAFTSKGIVPGAQVAATILENIKGYSETAVAYSTYTIVCCVQPMQHLDASQKIAQQLGIVQARYHAESMPIVTIPIEKEDEVQLRIESYFGIITPSVLLIRPDGFLAARYTHQQLEALEAFMSSCFLHKTSIPIAPELVNQ